MIIIHKLFIIMFEKFFSYLSKTVEDMYKTRTTFPFRAVKV